MAHRGASASDDESGSDGSDLPPQAPVRLHGLMRHASCVALFSGG
jgi:hypothetical protein